MNTIAERTQAIRQAIYDAAVAAGRDPQSVTLLAVSKTHSAEVVRAACAAGLSAFGENYVQEALDKIASLGDLPLEWHFIGPIQSNKTRPLAEHFDWVHGVDRLRIAQRLAESRPANLLPLNVCIQVNVSGEESKSGCAPEELPALAAGVAAMPRLRLRGLMAIPEPTSDLALQHRRFRMLAEMQADLVGQGFPLDTLSMGMSDDYPVAIAEGATIVRIGTAIFGKRSAVRDQPSAISNQLSASATTQPVLADS